MVSLIVFWRLTPKKDMVCSSVLVLQCWRVPLIPPSTGRSLVRHHSRERNQEQLGGAEKIKSGEERLLTLHRDLPCFSPFQGVFPCVFRQPIWYGPYFVCFSFFLSFDMLWYFGSRWLVFPSLACWILYPSLPCTARRVWVGIGDVFIQSAVLNN